MQEHAPSAEQETQRNTRAAVFLGVSLATAVLVPSGVWAWNAHSEHTAEAPAPGTAPVAEALGSVTIDLASLPSTVPKAVQAAIPLVVKIESTFPNGASSSGSGVMITDRLIATASHVITMDGQVQAAACGRQIVLSPNNNTGGITATDKTKAYPEPVRDVGLLELDSNDIENLDVEVTTATFRDFSKEPLREGEPVWTVGWAAGGHDFTRTPYKPDLDPQHSRAEKIAQGYNAPHVTGGFIVNTERTAQSKDKFDMLQGLRNYSTLMDRKGINPGDSGGAVIDYKGHIVGVISSATLEPYTLDTLAHSFNFADITFKNQPQDFTPIASRASFIDPKRIEQLRSKPALPCKPERSLQQK